MAKNKIRNKKDSMHRDTLNAKAQSLGISISDPIIKQGLEEVKNSTKTKDRNMLLIKQFDYLDNYVNEHSIEKDSVGLSDVFGSLKDAYNISGVIAINSMEKAKTYGAEKINEVTNTVVDGYNSGREKIGAAYETATDFAKEQYVNATDFGKEQYTKATNFGKEQYAKATNFVGEQYDKAKGYGKKFINSLSGFAKKQKENILTVFSAGAVIKSKAAEKVTEFKKAVDKEREFRAKESQAGIYEKQSTYFMKQVARSLKVDIKDPEIQSRLESIEDSLAEYGDELSEDAKVQIGLGKAIEQLHSYSKEKSKEKETTKEKRPKFEVGYGVQAEAAAAIEHDVEPEIAKPEDKSFMIGSESAGYIYNINPDGICTKTMIMDGKKGAAHTVHPREYDEQREKYALDNEAENEKESVKETEKDNELGNMVKQMMDKDAEANEFADIDAEIADIDAEIADSNKNTNRGFNASRDTKAKEDLDSDIAMDF